MEVTSLSPGLSDGGWGGCRQPNWSPSSGRQPGDLTSLRKRHTLVSILAFSFNNCMCLRKVSDLSRPQFLYSWSMNVNAFLIDLP